MGGGFGYECYIDINCASIDFGLRASIFSLSSASKGSISAAGPPGNVDPAAAPVLTSTVKRRSLGATVTTRTPSFGGRNGAFKDECGSVVTIEVS